MAVKIVLANAKGGVGKTTTAASVSAFLAAMGKRVLAMDFDPQSNLTIALGIDHTTVRWSLREVFEGTVPLARATVNALPNLDIVPARPDLMKVLESPSVSGHLRRNEIIRFKLPSVDPLYDFIIIDSPPAEPHVFTHNSLAVADYAVIPVQLDRFSLEGLSQMLNLLAEVRSQYLNPRLRILGILGTFFQKTRNCLHHLELLEHLATGKARIFSTRIRRNVALSSCVSSGVPITHYDRKCNGYRDYESLTREVLTNAT
jgi:chromosome partitioning protein